MITKPGLRINWAPGLHTLSRPPFKFNFKIIVSLGIYINDCILLLYSFVLYKIYIYKNIRLINILYFINYYI